MKRWRSLLVLQTSTLSFSIQDFPEFSSQGFVFNGVHNEVFFFGSFLKYFFEVITDKSINFQCRMAHFDHILMTNVAGYGT